MPAPPGPALMGLVVSGLSQPPPPQQLAFIQALTSAIANSWTSWNSALTWGALNVTGAGIGVWTGVGVGGVIVSSAPFALPAVPFAQGTTPNKMFVSTLAQVLPPLFASWATSFKFAGVNYLGSSSATPISPGPFTANVIPIPLNAAGVGIAPMAPVITAQWQPLLIASGFNLPQAPATTALMNAIAKGIDQAFSTLYLLSSVQANTVIGVAAPPAGLGVGVSLPSGVIV